MLVQKKDKLYFAGIILFGVLEALFIILQMYFTSFPFPYFFCSLILL